MKKLKLTMAMGVMLVVGSAFAAGTFDSIPFDTPIYSDTDPLGVTAIQEADTKASNAATAASNAATAASEASVAASAAQSKANATEAKVTAIETSMETVTNSMTKVGDTVVVGSMKGTPQDVGLLAGTNSIVMAVDRDSDEINPEDGQILFAADNIKFDSPLSGIFFGSTSLESLLAESGQGEVNTIVTVKTNGVAMTPDSNRAIDIIIPSAGEGNVIEGITVNGDTVAPDANKIVALTIPDAGQSNVVETIKVNGAVLTPDADKAVDITIPAPGESNIIEKVKVNGSELTPDGDKAVDITIPAPGESNVVVTVKVNGSALTPDADRAVDITVPTTFTTSAITDLNSYKNPAISTAALTAINGIANAQDIATIKSTLTNFLNQFVIQAAP